MSKARFPIEQADTPRSPKETLPTMSDLLSEDPEEAGLPDEYHLWLQYAAEVFLEAVLQ